MIVWTNWRRLIVKATCYFENWKGWRYFCDHSWNSGNKELLWFWEILLFMLPNSGKHKKTYPSSHFVCINAAHSDAFYKFFSLYIEVLRTNIRIKYIFFRRKLHVNYFIRQGMPLRRSVNNFHILVPSEIVWFLVQRIWNKKSPNPCWIPKDLIKNCFSICL